MLSASHVALYHPLALFHLNRSTAAASTAGLRAAPASVVTDRADYLPGDRSVITGSGFRPGERVRLQVLHTDGTPNTATEHRPWRVRADARGGFTTTYTVGEDDLHTALRVTATGVASGRVARHRFTDGQKSSTTTRVTSSANPTVYGQPVTFTATVTGGTRTATGTVTFLDGGTSIGTGSLNSAGQATLTTSSLAVRSHTITARYAGDSRSAASTSPALTQTVSRAATTTTISLGGSSGGGGAASGPVLRPDHVVVVIEEDRAANAIGDPNMPYFNQLASSGLLYSDSHGVNPSSQEGEQDYLALYSGSTQGVTDNARGYSFAGPNLSKSLYSAGLSFAGYAEFLPADGSQVQQAGDSVHPDIYVRNYNPMAMFTDAGPGVSNATVNRTFNAFKSFANQSTQYATLPTVSFVVPDTLDSTHGSNEAPPYATDPGSYNLLRGNADTWLRQNLDGYLQWAKTHNSLLIVTGDEGDRAHNFAAGVTTIVNGDPRLFVPGTDATTINHYNVLRTIEDMYGLTPLGSTAGVSGLNTNAQGQLADPQSSTPPPPPPPESQPGTSVVGQPVTFTARVAPVSPGAGTPTGSVQFKVDGANYGSPVALTGGVATSPAMSALAAGSHSITAVYNSDVNFTASTAPGVTQTVTQANTALALAASTSSVVYGQPVTLNATIAVTSPGGGTPAGVVTFTDGSATLGTATLNASGIATLTVSSLAVGSHSLAASYGGNANYSDSASSAQSVAVARAATTASLTSSANPATEGQGITFTATIAAASPSAGTPTGTVQFRIDGADFGGPIALAGGSATSPVTSALAAGSHTITAIYSGDGNFNASTAPALTQAVNGTSTTTATTTTLSTSANPTVFGQSVTLTATVATSAGGTPTGKLTIMDGSTILATLALDATGHAALTTSALSVSSHTITATYSGDASFAGSTSASLAQTVNRATTTTAIASSANPVTAGQTVNFTATIAVVSPGAGTPSGTVQFVIDGANFGSPVPLGAGGTATSASTATLAAGSHTVTATYSGDGSFAGSTSGALSQAVSSTTNTNNDNFANRMVLSGSSVTVTGSNSGATKEAGEPNHAGNAGGKSVWWTWTAPSDGTVTIDTSGSSFDTLLAVYTGTSVSALSAVPGGSNDDSPAGGTMTSKVSFPVTAGTAYQIAVDGYGGAAGNITLHLSLGATVTTNDNFANRTTLSGTAVTATGSNVGATKEAGEPNHAGTTGGKSVWWTWTAPTSGMLTIDTLGSSFDTLLAVYTGTSVSSLTAIPGGSNDDSPAGGTTTSKVTFAVTAGMTYQIAVDGYGGVSGSITLHLNLA